MRNTTLIFSLLVVMLFQHNVDARSQFKLSSGTGFLVMENNQGTHYGDVYIDTGLTFNFTRFTRLTGNVILPGQAFLVSEIDNARGQSSYAYTRYYRGLGLAASLNLEHMLMERNRYRIFGISGLTRTIWQDSKTNWIPTMIGGELVWESETRVRQRQFNTLINLGISLSPYTHRPLRYDYLVSVDHEEGIKMQMLRLGIRF